ncbi:amino acid ABC transporter permease [Ancylobacter sp.]|uniref:amino acid ABC transporter permease n=1 Tax=Ancylobacter sp. TaxID=1872567 RepID=UPI003BA94705
MATFDLALRYWPMLADGLLLTVGVSLAGIALALVAAIPLAACKHSRQTLRRLPASGLIEVLRNAPFIMVLFLVHFGLPRLGVRPTAWESGIIALALYGSAYFAEVLLAAYRAVPMGQTEAARSLGLSRCVTLRRVIAPQMVSVGLPPARVIAIMLLKDSAILSVIAVPELTHATLRIQAETFDTLGTFIITAALYWLLAAALGGLLDQFDRGASERRRNTLRGSPVARRYLALDGFRH